jgi:hypothetical protein
MLRDYDRKVMELISVDDFESHELGAQAQHEPDSAADDFHLAPGQVA